MAKIIEACDSRDMAVLVGVLYWGAQQRNLANEYYSDWKQKEANTAMIIQSFGSLRDIFTKPFLLILYRKRFYIVPAAQAAGSFVVSFNGIRYRIRYRNGVFQVRHRPVEYPEMAVYSLPVENFDQYFNI